MFNQFLLIIGLLFYYFYNSRKKVTNGFPPGPLRIPFIGNLLQLVIFKKQTPFQTYHELSKKYGPITFIEIGNFKQVILEDYEIIKEVLTTDDFVERYYSQWMTNRSFGKILGILMIGGKVWKEMRRFCIRTLRDFGFGKQKSMEAELNFEIKEFISKIEKRIGDGGSICMKKLFTVSVLNILWTMIAGRRFCYDDNKIYELLHIIEEEVRLNPIGQLTSPLYLYSAFPFLSNVVPFFTGRDAEFMKLQIRFQKIFSKMLDERRSEGQYTLEQRDYVDVFLKKIDFHKDDTKATNLYTDEQFIIVTRDLFMAGSETTSNTLEFAIFYLIKNPLVQLKIQTEIEAVIGRARLPCISDKVNMPYTEATILEVQRLGNVIPLDIRGPATDCNLRGYRIPANTAVVINLHAMHMNKETWGDPMSFRPERFLNDANKIVNAHKILPFGAGKRGCIGEQLAKATLFIYITTMLQKFSFEESSTHPLPNDEPNLGFTLSPQTFYTLVKPRKLFSQDQS